MAKKKKLKYYEDCRLELSFVSKLNSDITGIFESDPMTVRNVLALMVATKNYKVTITDFDGRLGIKKSLTLRQVSQLANDQEKYYVLKEQNGKES